MQALLQNFVVFPFNISVQKGYKESWAHLSLDVKDEYSGHRHIELKFPLPHKENVKIHNSIQN